MSNTTRPFRPPPYAAPLASATAALALLCALSGLAAAAGEPAASEPAASEPVASESAADEPAENEPAAAEPPTSESAADDPAEGESAGAGPREVAFDTADGGRIYGLLRGAGAHAVVLAHGAVFDKESWDPLAEELAAQGLRVLAIDFRGYGESEAGSRRRALHQDVLGAVRYLREAGAERISLLGGSMGGAAVARAATQLEEDEVDRVILLSFVPRRAAVARRVKGRKLVVLSEDEPRAARMKTAFESLAEPKRLVALPGSAHAQHVFDTAQGDKLTRLLVDFLTEPQAEQPASEPGESASEGQGEGS